MRFRDLREDRDLTQREVSEHLHIRQSTLSQCENGQRQIPLELLKELAVFFDTSTDYLLGLTNEKSPIPEFDPGTGHIHDSFFLNGRNGSVPGRSASVKAGDRPYGTVHFSGAIPQSPATTERPD